MTRVHSLVVLCSLAGLIAALSPGVRAQGTLQPVTRIAHERIDECSGIVWLDGAYYVHNDSGDDPVVYRSRSLDFSRAEILRVEGAKAVDWEDIAVLDGDLLIGDIGDNRRERGQVTLYRARYEPGAPGGAGRLRLIATYPFRYPDGPHDAEGLVVIDGVAHVVTKARGEPRTWIYRFDRLRGESELGPGEVNEPRPVGSLDLHAGEQVTAAAFHAGRGQLVLLTYTQILCYPRQRLEGAPRTRTLLAARQSEALCFQGDRLIVANEQRDVFVIDHFLPDPPPALLPELGEVELPVCAARPGAACDCPDVESGAVIPLRNAGAGERLRWCLAGDLLCLSGRLHIRPGAEPLVVGSTADEGGLGSALLLGFGGEERTLIAPQDMVLAIGVDAAGRATVARVDLTADPIPILSFAAQISGGAQGNALSFDLAVSTEAIWQTTSPDRWRLDVQGYRLKEGREVRFSGPDHYAMWRPYVWGRVTVRR